MTDEDRHVIPANIAEGSPTHKHKRMRFLLAFSKYSAHGIFVSALAISEKVNFN